MRLSQKRYARIHEDAGHRLLVTPLEDSRVQAAVADLKNPSWGDLRQAREEEYYRSIEPYALSPEATEAVLMHLMSSGNER